MNKNKLAIEVKDNNTSKKVVSNKIKYSVRTVALPLNVKAIYLYAWNVRLILMNATNSKDEIIEIKDNVSNKLKNISHTDPFLIFDKDMINFSGRVNDAAYSLISEITLAHYKKIVKEDAGL